MMRHTHCRACGFGALFELNRLVAVQAPARPYHGDYICDPFPSGNVAFVQSPRFRICRRDLAARTRHAKPSCVVSTHSRAAV